MSGSRRWSRGRIAAAVLLAAYLLFLGLILFNPSARLATDTVVSAYDVLVSLLGEQTWLTGKRVEFATNLAMFVPLGLLIPLVFPRLNWRDVTVTAFLISSGVEIYQGVLLPHRSAEFADVVANTLGCALGAVVLTPFLPRRH
ncbi:MAG TPA: VanZ family protein [Marmoricola sp.]|nr:VanZ family protein [Marmoricola sp.]HNN47843.1 VanZ family protein [Marmoricola sp.]HNO39190.1 VanZ family protein [Marmoricola sp.]